MNPALVDGRNTRFRIRGAVLSNQDGRLLDFTSLRVTAFDVRLGGDQPLSEEPIDSSGLYAFVYDPASILASGKSTIDLVVRLHSADAPAEWLASSAVRFNAGPDELIDIDVADQLIPSVDEFTRLIADLSRHLSSSDGTMIRLRDLQENPQCQDITFLAHKTGWDPRLVAMASLAERAADSTSVPAELHYALYRAGLPAEAQAIAHVPVDQVERVWRHASQRQVIPTSVDAEIPNHLQTVAALGAAAVLDQPTGVGTTTLTDLLAGTPLAPADHKKFAEIYHTHQGDWRAFWSQIETAFGTDTVRYLQLMGKLAFLTDNNPQLISHLHETAPIQDPVDLVRAGFYDASAWNPLLTAGNLPDNVLGPDEPTRRANYATVLAERLRVSYPTAVIAEKISNGDIRLGTNAATTQTIADFLRDQHGSFELGMHPIAQYVGAHGISMSSDTLAGIKKAQRVSAISPTDDAMATLLIADIDSAFAVTRYDEQTFVAHFAQALGGADTARLVHAKSMQIQQTNLAMTTNFLLSRTAPTVRVVPAPSGSGSFSAPGPSGGGPAPGSSAPALAAPVDGGPLTTGVPLPTLEGLFGAMDYCACDDCRSVLSPAAYLVDLLDFLDTEPATSSTAGGTQASAASDIPNPLTVLLGRRPDLQHLALSCANTNTELPYVDLANEILEYAVVHASLDGFEGHDVPADVSSTELLAGPQYLNNAAYDVLRTQVLPGLPYDRDLETVRAYLTPAGIRLATAMEQLRASDVIESPAPGTSGYGWRDITAERLGISRQERGILTDSSIAVQALFGDDPAVVSEAALVGGIANAHPGGDPPAPGAPPVTGMGNARLFARRMGLAYSDVIDLVGTRFVNPDTVLLPLLQSLAVPFTMIKALHDGTLAAAAFLTQLPAGLDPAPYGGDVPGWVDAHYIQIMNLTVLADPTGASDMCGFSQLEFRRALPDFTQNKIRVVDLLRMARFVRLRARLGWSIALTDTTLTALYPPDQLPLSSDTDAVTRTKLDAGFATTLFRLGHLLNAADLLGLSTDTDLPGLLACFAPLDTAGPDSLYQQIFLSAAILHTDPVFGPDPSGAFLQASQETLFAHAVALQAAFTMTPDDFAQICAAAPYTAETPLTLDTVSAVFRHGFLARALGMSVPEMIALIALSGLSPFSPLDQAQPDFLRLIQYAQLIGQAGISLSRLDYYLRAQDPTGRVAPDPATVLSVALSLRSNLYRIDQQYAAVGDTTGTQTRTFMALVYPPDAVDSFFGLLNTTTSYTVAYTQPGPGLDPAIVAITARLSFDSANGVLTYQGVMTTEVHTALSTAITGLTVAPAGLAGAVTTLFNSGQADAQLLFGRYPELEALFTNFDHSTDPLPDKIEALLASFLPPLRDQLKRAQLGTALATAFGSDPSTVATLLENVRLLQAAADATQPGIQDVLALDTPGVSARFYADTHLTEPPTATAIVANIDYPATTALGGAAGGSVNGIWSCYLEPPDNNAYTFTATVDAAATITLSIDGTPVPLTVQPPVIGTTLSSLRSAPLPLAAGTLHRLVLQATAVTTTLILHWDGPAVGRGALPDDALCPTSVIDAFAATYIRSTKALALAADLHLSPPEMSLFATTSSYRINGSSWLDALPTTAAAESGPADLFATITAMMRYRQLRSAWAVTDDSLVDVLTDPAWTTPGHALTRITGWDITSIAAVLGHLGRSGTPVDLDVLIRMKDAFKTAATLGLTPAAALGAITAEPTPQNVADLQNGTRARYDEADWLAVVQPISDSVRRGSRDALVACVLAHLNPNPDAPAAAAGGATPAGVVDTADKLYERLLIDVEMDPCMQTSRIAQAISTVQLFVSRCLLNLEPGVAPASINAAQWEWMKRYRLWEANREVFLFPENWLDPELRDDKSPFFRDLETELLQTDITDDAAALALGHYLEKLDEVAALEIAGMYIEEPDPKQPAADIVHVIGRTAGAKRDYYYRRLDPTWTPWEKITVDIPDNPILPVVWQGRQFIFWLTVNQTPTTPPGDAVGSAPATTPITQLTLGDIRTSTAVTTVTATLSWTEFYNGTWQPARTSDITRPIVVSTQPPTPGTPIALRLESVVNDDNTLGIVILNPNTGGGGNTWFHLYTTHSLPVRKDDEPGPTMGYPLGRTFSATGKLTVTSSADLLHPSVLLRNMNTPYDTVAPMHPLIEPVATSPFFVQDSRYAFYVDVISTSPTVATAQAFGTFPPPRPLAASLPSLLVPPAAIRLDSPNPVAFGATIIGPNGSVHTAPAGPRPRRGSDHP